MRKLYRSQVQPAVQATDGPYPISAKELCTAYVWPHMAHVLPIHGQHSYILIYAKFGIFTITPAFEHAQVVNPGRACFTTS